MFPRSVDPMLSTPGSSVESGADVDAVMARSEALVGIEEV